MKYAVEMVSGAMIYISSFVKIGLGIQQLIGGIYKQADIQTLREHGDFISLLLFFKKRKVG
jgi:hypothetical protein